MGLVAMTLRADSVLHRNEVRDGIDQAWYKIIERRGHSVLLIPNNLSIARELLQTIRPDFLLLTGGNDLKSVCGGGDSSVARDEVEDFLLDVFISKNMPVLGVCRGMQKIIEFMSHGKINLVSDTGHINTQHWIYPSDQSGRNCEKQLVNSFHFWTVPKNVLPSSLQPMYVDEDGNIEAYTSGGNIIQGIMWHPERERVMTQLSSLIFDNFFGETNA